MYDFRGLNHFVCATNMIRMRMRADKIIQLLNVVALQGFENGLSFAGVSGINQYRLARGRHYQNRIAINGSHIQHVNPKFAAEKPEAVKGFIRAFLKGLQDTVKNPATAVDSVIKRNDVAKKEVELERLQIALKDNILTPEVKKNGFGGVDMDRLDKSVDQIALTYQFKNAKPKGTEVFDPSYLPDAALRKAE